jgi:quinol monooxygenase YgiN
MPIVIVQGVFVVNPNEREEFLSQSGETMRSSRAEPGCLEYVMAADPLDPGRVILSERWASTDALNEHLRGVSARRKEAAAQGGGSGAAPISAEITLYEVASSRPLG